jgi:hypothetical protein
VSDYTYTTPEREREKERLSAVLMRVKEKSTSSPRNVYYAGLLSITWANESDASPPQSPKSRPVVAVVLFYRLLLIEDRGSSFLVQHHLWVGQRRQNEYIHGNNNTTHTRGKQVSLRNEKESKTIIWKKERTNKKTDPSPSPATNAVHPRAGDV